MGTHRSHLCIDDGRGRSHQLFRRYSAEESRPDPWAAVRFLVGQWSGNASGEPGEGAVARTYEFVLNNRYIHERNVSTYPVQEKNPKGEVHEHWSMLSYDRIRKRLVLRQFHTEGFVNQYVFSTAESSDSKLVFESESLENLSADWRAREIYERVGENEFTEVFQIAEPGQSFKTYSQSRFKRRAK
jgi:hypothetical protein